MCAYMHTYTKNTDTHTNRYLCICWCVCVCVLITSLPASNPAFTKKQALRLADH